MRSGNGRHRRPRQAPALLVTAGVTSAGLAMPLLAAGSAQAADGGAWDRVAECESGGMWSANSGNGHYGGLQLTLETWDTYGGKVFAARPDLASRSQQIEIAEKVLEDQGTELWSSCSAGVDLLPDASEEPGAPTPTPTPSPEPGSTEEPAGDPSPTPSPSQEDGQGGDGQDGGDSASPEPSPTESVPSGPTPSPTASGSGEGDPGAGDTTAPDDGGGSASEPPTPDTGTGTGRHRGSPDKRERGDATDRPSRGDGHEGGPDDQRRDNPDQRRDGQYRVRPGDSLSLIAAEHDLEGGWTALYERNKDVVGSDPDLILPGQRLEL